MRSLVSESFSTSLSLRASLCTFRFSSSKSRGLSAIVGTVFCFFGLDEGTKTGIAVEHKEGCVDEEAGGRPEMGAIRGGGI